MADSTSWPARGEGRVFVAEVAGLSADRERLERWLDWLTPAEEARFDRFRHDADRVLFLCGRGMAREIVGRALDVAPGAWQWREGPHGRPEIDGPDDGVRFNVAHSAGLVVCGVARGGEIGVDVEDMGRRPVDPAIVRRYCSVDEAADIESRRPAGWLGRFLEYWTLKEAYLKAQGLGIAVPLASLSFRIAGDRADLRCLPPLTDDGRAWAFTLYRPSPQHIGAVATHGVEVSVHPFE
jgi:4'-phosphopantetheinyl transferase